MNTTIDRIGLLNEKIKELVLEKENLVTEVKRGKNSVLRGTEYIGTITYQDRTYIDKKLIPAKILEKCQKIQTIQILRVELKKG